ncbi:hypothetical protein [Nocardia jejuensis]|uniref:hypothetical protein n=1 Tax=Nocardia jejuensis TaxID=328049 RepID=UPI0012F8F841|nr:hypothetical protein [Nocardia jejuensis]
MIAGGAAAYFAVARDGRESESVVAGGMAGGFDNLTTLDPCSYLEPRQFAEFADTGFGDGPAVRIEPSGFSTCDVQIERSAAAGAGNSVTVHVEAGRIVPSEMGKSVSVVQRGALQVAEIKEADRPTCEQYIFRSDGTGVRLSVDTLSLRGPDSADTLCRIRDTAGKAASDALEANRADRIEYPADSLGGTDPCTRLEVSEITAATKSASVAKTTTGPASMCRWDAGQAKITLSAELIPKSEANAKGTTETIAGRQSTVEPSSRNPTCRVTVYGRAWEPWLGKHSNYTQAINDTSSQFQELTRLYVQLSGNTTSDDACLAARTLAANAWTRLPHN